MKPRLDNQIMRIYALAIILLVPLFALQALSASVATPTEGAREMPFEIRLPPGESELVPVLLHLADPQPDLEPMEPVPAHAPLRSVLKGQPKVWRMWVEADGYWSPARMTPAVSQREATVFQLYPTGQLHGRLQVPADETQPEQLVIRFEQAANAPATPLTVPRDQVECPVARDGSFLCTLPAGTLDLRLRARGFASNYHWSTTISRGLVTQLGALPLQRGGSVVGRVELTPDTPHLDESLAGTTIEITPAQASRPDTRQAGERLQRMQHSVEADSRGFFHITGLSPGLYELRASKEGAGEAVYPPLQVHENAETTLTRPVTLQPPVRLRLTVHPSIDPLQRRWRAEILDPDRTGAALRRASTGTVTAEGLWTSGELQHKPYILLLVDDDGNRWWHERFHPGQQQQIDLRLDMVPVEGSVTLEGEPLADATLWFGGRNGLSSLRTLADQEGHFSTLLPAEGEWKVDLSTAAPHLDRRLPAIDIDAGEKGWAEVEIALRDFSLRGEVRDSQGEPVRAMLLLVGASNGTRPIQAWSETDGTFAFRGLDPGLYEVQAYASGGAISSERQRADLDDSGASPYLTLHLGDAETFVGSIVSTFGPVPGAAVFAMPLRGGETIAVLQPQAQSDANGRFSLPLPPNTDALDVIVAPPGYALSTHRISTAASHSGEPMAIPVHRQGGTLVLEFDPGQTLSDLYRIATLQREGVRLDAGTLLRWRNTYSPSGYASGSESTDADPWATRIPMLEFGTYTACRRGADRDCVSGYLPPGGELVLSLTTKSSEVEPADPATSLVSSLSRR